MNRVLIWFHRNYDRIINWSFFFMYILIGLAIAYSPPADSLYFLIGIVRGIDRRVLGWFIFILPSPIFLLKRSASWKFLGVTPLAFILSSISWFVFITPNRSWLIIPVFALCIILSAAHYFRLMIHDL